MNHEFAASFNNWVSYLNIDSHSVQILSCEVKPQINKVLLCGSCKKKKDGNFYSATDGEFLDGVVMRP